MMKFVQNNVKVLLLLVAMLFTTIVFAQQKTITGKVTDDQIW
jgi:hypothetical protein